MTRMQSVLIHRLEVRIVGAGSLLCSVLREKELLPSPLSQPPLNSLLSITVIDSF